MNYFIHVAKGFSRSTLIHAFLMKNGFYWFYIILFALKLVNDDAVEMKNLWKYFVCP